MARSRNALSPAWQVGPDGIRCRAAARVILLDGDGRALLMRGHDADRPDRSWWFTLGGGIEPGETPVQAAAREVFEETGITLDPSQLVGPVLIRRAYLHFVAETCRQDETYFFARLPEHRRPDRDGWTADERQLIDEVAWLTPDELRRSEHEIFPHLLPDIIDQLAGGWNGTTTDLGDEHDRATPEPANQGAP